ncbi:hypothetical protein NC651_000313 [Populus alba x Populus x berolinensis]|nr:hypothetical protein NC651_000313 [Populus alba x Populus x berolinensis]
MSDESETRKMFSTSQFRTQLNTTLACGFGLLLSSKGKGVQMADEELNVPARLKG